MIPKEEFISKGLKEEAIDIYSMNFNMFTGEPQPTSFMLVMEVDNTEENELGTFIVSKVNNKIIRTGYYESVEDLLGDIKI